VARAKATAETTRALLTDPLKLKPAVTTALEKSGGKGPAMVDALKEAIASQFNVTMAVASMRSLMKKLKKAGLLESEASGTSYIWRAGSGVPEEGFGRRGRRPVSKPVAVRQKPAKPARPAKATRPAKSSRGESLRKAVSAARKAEPRSLPAFKPRTFRGKDTADHLVFALEEAVRAAMALRDEMRTVEHIKDELEDVIRRLS
jgi:hypothetical protein